VALLNNGDIIWAAAFDLSRASLKVNQRFEIAANVDSASAVTSNEEIAAGSEHIA
jgi:hypothetical protein